jgi:hypothetical protein
VTWRPRRIRRDLNRFGLGVLQLTPPGPKTEKEFNRFSFFVDDLIANDEREILFRLQAREWTLRDAYDWIVKKKGREPDLRTPRERGIATRLYAISRPDTGEIKVGIAGDTLKRLAGLQTGSAVELVLLMDIPGGRTSERSAHHALAAFRIRGEWFRDCPELRQWIAERVK